jgi:hypothetical protein
MDMPNTTVGALLFGGVRSELLVGILVVPHKAVAEISKT